MLALRNHSRFAVVLFLYLGPFATRGAGATREQNTTAPTAPAQNPGKPAKPGQPQKPPSADDELRQAIDAAGNDRAALLRNLESFLAKYPQSSQRVQVYRALVEASVQLRDMPKAANYAERIVALSPDDISMTLLAVQLLERTGDDAGLKRAQSYTTRVMDYLDRTQKDEKSPKVSPEEWEAEKKRDRMSLLLVQGRLSMKLRDIPAAQKEFLASYALRPNAAAAEQLGEIAETRKDWNEAAKQYARAFSLNDNSDNSSNRHELRQKLGNSWRLAHGSEDGLGDFLLRTYDEVSSSSAPHTTKNAGLTDPLDFLVRKAPDGSAFSLKDAKGKVLVLSFWATWCGPCRAMESHFDNVALQYQQKHDVLFLSVNADEDESLVAPYLEETKPKTTVVFADGLDRLLGVDSFPTIIILTKSGKISYRAAGFDPDNPEKDLAEAVRNAMTSDTTSK